MTVWMDLREPCPGGRVTPAASVRHLMIGARALNILNYEGCETIASVLAIPKIGWMRVPGCGKTTLAEIDTALREVGYQLRESY